MDFADLPTFTAFLTGKLERELHQAKAEALEAGAALIAQRAKDLIGEPHSFWPPLQPATIARKAAGNTPLLETGVLRDSVSYHIVTPGEEAEIGSNDDRAVYHELGTSRIPARPFLSSAAAQSEKDCAKLLKEATNAVFERHSVTGEILKIAHDVAKDLARDVREFVDNDDHQNKHEGRHR